MPLFTLLTKTSRVFDPNYSALVSAESKKIFRLHALDALRASKQPKTGVVCLKALFVLTLGEKEI